MNASSRAHEVYLRSSSSVNPRRMSEPKEICSWRKDCRRSGTPQSDAHTFSGSASTLWRPSRGSDILGVPCKIERQIQLRLRISSRRGCFLDGVNCE